MAAAFREDASWALFLVFAFMSMLSMPVARIALVLSLLWMVARPAVRQRLSATPPTVGWLAYLALAVVVTAIAAATISDPCLVPRKGLSKLPKLLWFVAIPLTAAQVTSPARFRRVLEVLTFGGFIFALVVLFGDTSFAWLQVNYPTADGAATAPALARWLHGAATSLGFDATLQRWLSDEVWAPWGGRPPCFLYALTFNATLHDAQRLMVAFLCATAIFFAKGGTAPAATSAPAAPSPKPFGRLPVLAVPVAIAAALVITCKRAPLAAAIVAFGFLLARLSRFRKALPAIAAICLFAVAVPQSRARLVRIPAEMGIKSGGRTMMWTRITPALHREYPWGIGFRALTDRKMRSIDRHVEPNRTHVHSTPLQALVDFGWPGLFVWAFWMFLSFRSAARLARGRGIPPALPPSLRCAPLAALVALFLVSLVEYNIADAAVVMLYGPILGLAAPHFAHAGHNCENGGQT